MAPKKQARAPPSNTLDGLLQARGQRASSGSAAIPPSTHLAAEVVLTTVKACGCDTRIGVVALAAEDGCLVLHIQRLLAAAALWRSGPSRVTLATACRAFALGRPASARSGALVLSRDDEARLGSSDPPPGLRLAALLGAAAEAHALAAVGFPAWGRPVASDEPWAQEALPLVRRAFFGGAESRYHVAAGGRPTWQVMRSKQELADDRGRLGTAVEDLEVEVSWKDGVAVSRPPFVLRP